MTASVRLPRYETTIFVITSGITKLSKVTAIPANRLLYRGLGGMLLPDKFWKPSAAEFQGGVEYGLMSTTTDRAIAIHYSGADKRRAIIFEIQAGRVDIGGSLRFVSQYPGEDEFLMQPLSCLEVMGRPRVEATAQGEVVVFPMRVNVNLKSLTVEQLVARRKELHLAMSTNLREELFQQLDEEVAAGSRRDAPAPAAQGPVETPLPVAVGAAERTAAALDAAEQVLAAARERAAAAESALEEYLGRVELLRGDAGQAVIDTTAFTVKFLGQCCVGAPRIAVSSGRMYYEVELLQVCFGDVDTQRFVPAPLTRMPVSQLGQDSRPHLGFAGARLDRGKAGLGIGEDQASWAVDGTRQKLFHGEFGVGDRVRGLYKNGKWYLASVEAYNPDDGTYLLKWDDGDSQDRVKTPEQLQAADGDEARWGAAWQAGDVIGLACDLDRGALVVSVNGDFAPPNGVAFARGLRPGPSAGPALFPAFSGRDMVVSYNLGADLERRPFRGLASADGRGGLEVVRGDPAQALVDAAGSSVEFRGLCVVGAPRLAAAEGRVYYEIE